MHWSEVNAPLIPLVPPSSPPTAYVSWLHSFPDGSSDRSTRQATQSLQQAGLPTDMLSRIAPGVPEALMMDDGVRLCVCVSFW